MAYKALYRTYRPQTFDEVAGQQHIVKTLKNALATGKIAHAYLFAGPRGTGKTSMAKLFAKALNCDHGIGCQCNECKNCRAIIDGSHPDVLELDAASNNSVDDIRDLIDKVKYGTMLGRYKIYIIDEVHMLSDSAFNALLKTLEEPPEHVIFILATTEPHEILPTILSRCQRYDFEKVSDNDIKERIKIVLAKENVAYNDDAINLVIKLADGGMRDALSILEKVLAYSGNSLNEKDILDIFSLESTEEKLNLLKSIIRNDIKDILERLNKYVSSGTDIKRLTEDLLAILKDVLIYNASNSTAYLEVLKENEIKNIANELPSLVAIKMIDVLMEAAKDYKNVTSITPLFEITLLKMATIVDDMLNGRSVVKREPKIEESQSKPQYFEKKVENRPVFEQSKPTPKPVEINPAIDMQNIKLNDSVIYLKEAEGEDYFQIDKELMIKVMVTSKRDLKLDAINEWKNIKKYVGHSLLDKAATLLLDSHPLVVSNKIIIIEHDLSKTAEKINLKSNQLELQTLLSQIFNRKMFIYAVDRRHSIDLQNEYKNRLETKELPKASEVVLEFEGE